MKDEKCKNIIQSIITIILTLGGLFIMYFLFTVPIPEENKPVVYSIISACTTVYVGCMAYWFGGIHRDSEKDKMLFNSKPIDTEVKDEQS